MEAVAHRLGYQFNGVQPPKNEKDLYSVQYASFVVPLVKAVQEQQAMIEKQQAMINELKAKIEALEKIRFNSFCIKPLETKKQLQQRVPMKSCAHERSKPTK